MPKLSATERAGLPASAFAYIDSKGNRRLPINDESHVRNALARFERVKFETDADRERARKRLLNAAKKYGIVPVGFITGQLRTERKLAGGDPGTLPRGFVTFLLTDIEDSTGLLRRMGDGYAALLKEVRAVIRDAVRRGSGREVDARADEYFAVFEEPVPAVEAAMRIQRTLARRSWDGGVRCKVRAGIHSGTPTLTETGYIGLAVHAASRVGQAGHGGQILVSSRARTALRGSMPEGVRLRSLGAHPLSGLARPIALYQLEADGLATEFPPLRSGS